METLWNDADAGQAEGELGQVVYAAGLLGRQDSLPWVGGGRASIKRIEKNLWGEEEEILYIHTGKLAGGGFTPLYCRSLVRLARLEHITPAQLHNELACCRVQAAAHVPPPEAVLHAVLPPRCILSAEPEALLSIACTPGGPERLKEVCGDVLRVVPFPPGGSALALARACVVALGEAAGLAGILIPYYGLIAWGETARQAYNGVVEISTRAEHYLEHRTAWSLPALQAEEPDRPLGHDLAVLRKAISTAARQPLILTVWQDPASGAFCRSSDLAAQAPQGPASTRHTAFTRRKPIIGRNVEAYQAARQDDWRGLHPETPLPELDWTPRVVLDPDLGLCALGKTAGEARLAGMIFRRTIDIARRAAILEKYEPSPAHESVEAASFPSQAALEGEERLLFTGEVALVTGGASGIGRACVEALLRRGAAVASLDVNPKIKTLYDRPDFLGLECDLTDEAAILRGFEALARAFGGLDMLVLNAGIFPPGCRIEALSLAEWQRVMRINLDSNLVVLREAYPLLKQSPAGGRVLVNASKNVLAPGAGAAAYSASKAAVTQMARVAALEWGKDRIRVNLIHPDAVFDTGIWTEEALGARAAYYGLTVQQYKTRNILGVELNSRYVAELAAEMLGPHFEKITGAQIPVDGGSDRVI